VKSTIELYLLVTSIEAFIEIPEIHYRTSDFYKSSLETSIETFIEIYSLETSIEYSVEAFTETSHFKLICEMYYRTIFTSDFYRSFYRNTKYYIYIYMKSTIELVTFIKAH